MARASEILKVSKRGPIMQLTMNRPAKRNALNDEVIEALDAVFSAIPDDVRVIVLGGEGGHFSSGLDLSEAVHREPHAVMTHSRNWHRVMDLIEFSGVPVVAALTGAVMGGGLEVASACHVRVAEESVKFRMPEGLRGIFVGGGGSVRIGKLIGASRMTEMMLTGRTYSGREGVDVGLAHYVTPEGMGLDKALALAETIAENSPAINRMIVQSLSRIADMPKEAGLYTESLAAAMSQTGPDAEEGLKAFLEKRKPNFG
ncbi:crotonase/enoyl-CoA hydratase family protein [Pelagibacterium lentulum]|uniref:Enoyl-CoA hydratase n=1 Tax=Pelagibacterium lentulum TaxID=2029865 RepID=A0A916W2Q1_9HYPH|nr:crotonase/enoyl-CoA hydratase family protein [Pelagibacterium lentulum]GGA61383.1 enoyl-CoA hydratase [Pelagibacterium lentulum]